MSAYLICHVTVKDDAWMPDYIQNVHEIVEKHGGKYLSRSANITTVEGAGSGASIIALLEFPTMDALDAFVADPDYKPYADARMAGTTSTFEAIDDTDAAGTIPYLTPGG